MRAASSSGAPQAYPVQGSFGEKKRGRTAYRVDAAKGPRVYLAGTRRRVKPLISPSDTASPLRFREPSADPAHAAPGRARRLHPPAPREGPPLRPRHRPRRAIPYKIVPSTPIPLEDPMRIGMAMVVGVLLLAMTAAQQPAKPQESVFRSATRAVAVYATVSDAQGRLVPDLTQDDFEIYDEGKRQTITLFENGSQPITVVLLLDRSGSMVGNFNLVRSGAEQFVAALRPGDKARHRQLREPHPTRPARLHEQQARHDRDPPDRAAGSRADAALERRQRRHHGAPAPGRPPRRAGLHRRGRPSGR